MFKNLARQSKRFIKKNQDKQKTFIKKKMPYVTHQKTKINNDVKPS
jgi:uncharacterized FlgJ-related protein